MIQSRRRARPAAEGSTREVASLTARSPGDAAIHLGAGDLPAPAPAARSALRPPSAGALPTALRGAEHPC
jgi:hypothetical protein